MRLVPAALSGISECLRAARSSVDAKPQFSQSQQWFVSKPIAWYTLWLGVFAMDVAMRSRTDRSNHIRGRTLVRNDDHTSIRPYQPYLSKQFNIFPT